MCIVCQLRGPHLVLTPQQRRIGQLKQVLEPILFENALLVRPRRRVPFISGRRILDALLDRGDDAKIVAGTTECPKEIRVRGIRDDNCGAVGEHEVCREEVVC